MILALDVGNTNIVLGCMEGTEIRQTFRVATDRLRTEYEYAVAFDSQLRFCGVDPKNFSGAILSSVVPPLTNVLSRAVAKATGVRPLIVGAGVKTGVNILLDDPAEAGSDLIVAAAAALRLYKPPLALIDMGTATTISVLDKNGSFRGGPIVPGVQLSLDALTARTSLLPKIPLEAPERCIGTNTVDSMKSGSVLGAASMLDGMLDRIEDELGMKVTAVATGGIASSIVPYCRHSVVLNDDLLLYGLAVIYEKNGRREHAD